MLWIRDITTRTALLASSHIRYCLCKILAVLCGGWVWRKGMCYLRLSQHCQTQENIPQVLVLNNPIFMLAQHPGTPHHFCPQFLWYKNHGSSWKVITYLCSKWLKDQNTGLCFGCSLMHSLDLSWETGLQLIHTEDLLQQTLNSL